MWTGCMTSPLKIFFFPAYCWLMTTHVDNLASFVSVLYVVLVPWIIHIFMVNVKTLHVNYARMGDQVLLRIVQSKMAPLFPAQGNQMEERLGMFHTKIMVRKFQWPMSINCSLLVKEKEETKRKLTFEEEKGLVQCPKLGLQLLTWFQL